MTAESGLLDAHVINKPTVYLKQLRDRLGFAWYSAQAELRQRQITTVFGSLWLLLNPALTIAVYFVVFGLVLQTNRGIDGNGNFLVYITVGLFVFQYIQRAANLASMSIISSRGLLQAIRFPRALLPVSAVLTETFAATPTVLLALVVAIANDTMPTWRWLALPLIVGMLFLFNLGVAMIAARATTHFRDMQQLLPFVFRLLIYVSGVFYSVDAYLSQGWLNLLYYVNPAYGFIAMARWSIMGLSVPLSVVITTAAWTGALLVGGFFWFKAAEHTYDRV